MNVTLHDKEIRIQINEGTIHHRVIENFVQKYFSNVLSLSSTKIIYHKHNETYQKKYFLNWLHTAYKKVNSEVEENFLQTLHSKLHLPIRVKINGRQSVLNGIRIKITFPHKNIMKLGIEALSDVPKTFFANKFRKNLISAHGNELSIKTTVSSITELRNILDREKILGLPATFVYNKVTIAKLFAKLDARLRAQNSGSNNHRYNYHKQKNNHQSISQEHLDLIESYKLLECKKEDGQTVIKRKYLQLVKEFHPDTVYGQTEDIIKKYTDKFQKIRDAYSIIQSDLDKEAVA